MAFVFERGWRRLLLVHVRMWPRCGGCASVVVMVAKVAYGPLDLLDVLLARVNWFAGLRRRGSWEVGLATL
jgi:hypothetical protein